MDIFLFITLIFIAYIMGLMIVAVVDKHLGRLSINLPKQNVIVQLPSEKQSSQSQLQEGVSSSQSEVEHFTNFNPINQEWQTIEPEPEMDAGNLCYQNHQHGNCLAGRCNYPDPATLSPIDRTFYQYNFQTNFTLQDYINWLWQYISTKTENELPYEHFKNSNSLKKGEKIKYIPNHVQPVKQKNSQQYFDKLYADFGTKPLDLEKQHGYQSYNIGNYPQMVNPS